MNIVNMTTLWSLALRHQVLPIEITKHSFSHNERGVDVGGGWVNRVASDLSKSC